MLDRQSGDQASLFYEFRLDDRVPKNHLLRRINVVGNWTIVSEYQLLRDGTRREVYGAKPLGSLMFGADGRFSYVLFNPDRPKFASGDKSTGTPQDYQAAVQGGQAYFGTYSVDEAKASIIYHIEGALLTGSVQIVSRQILYW